MQSAQRRLMLEFVKLFAWGMAAVFLWGLLAVALLACVLDTGPCFVVKRTIDNLGEAVRLYALKEDRLPTNDEGLAVLLQPLGGKARPLLTELPVDYWKRPFRYRVRSSSDFEIASAGADGVFDTVDDLKSGDWQECEPQDETATDIFRYVLMAATLSVSLLFFRQARRVWSSRHPKRSEALK